MNFLKEYPEKIIPTIQIILSYSAFLGYAWKGDLRKTLYWLAAGTIATTITY